MLIIHMIRLFSILFLFRFRIFSITMTIFYVNTKIRIVSILKLVVKNKWSSSVPKQKIYRHFGNQLFSPIVRPSTWVLNHVFFIVEIANMLVGAYALVLSWGPASPSNVRLHTSKSGVSISECFKDYVVLWTILWNSINYRILVDSKTQN